MGLYAEFYTDDFGYPVDLGYGITADYSAGCQAFVDTFVSEARAMVPVRTGNLMSSISGNGGGNGGMVYADCEYAQYVEYGTWKMPAQPYFESALESAISVASTIWDQELQSGLSQVMAEAHNEAEEINQEYRHEGDDLRREMYQIALEIFEEMMQEAEDIRDEMLAEGGNEDAAEATYWNYVRLAHEVREANEAEADATRDFYYMLGEMMAMLWIAMWEMITAVLEMMPFPYAPLAMII